MIDKNLFTYITPLIYWLLIIMWCIIATFYIFRIFGNKKRNNNFLKILLIILFIDAVRSFIESSYFGIWYTSLSGLLDIKFYNFLARPEIVFFPKLMNLIVSIFIFVIIIRKWIPEENSRINEYKKVVNDYKLILEQIPVSIIITDTNGNIEFANKKFYTLTGYSPIEIIGNNPRILNSKKNDTTDFKKLWDTITSGNEWNGIFHNVKKNGEYYWEKAKIKPIFNSNGEIKNYLAIKEDITDSYEMDYENNILRTTIEQITDTVEILDLNRNIQYVNKAFLDITGFKKSEVIGKSPIDIFSDENNINAEMNKKFKIAMDNNQSSSGRFVNKVKNGTFITEDVKITPIFNKFGTLTNYSSIKRDVTESLLAEKEQKKIKDQLYQVQRLESVGQLVGGIAHDFNNSLSGILAAAQLLNSEQLNDKSKKYIDLIIKSSLRASGLTKKLLTFSKRKNSHFTTLHLNEIINDTVDILKQTIRRNITIEIKKNFTNDVILGDISAIQSLFINLGINASQAIKNSGSIIFSINNIFLDQEFCNKSEFEITEGYYCLVNVIDTGYGIDKNSIKMIFEPFYTTKSKDIGTGLGLSSALRTVKEHNGAINIDSIINEGTTFSIYLPISNKSESIYSNNNSHTVKGLGNILLIDDEETNRILGNDILESLGYNVTLAKDGAEAITILETNKREIDLILLDMIMPGISGYELFLKIKDIRKDIKIIILSGYINDIDITKLKENGLNDIIKKPYQITELSQTINRVLST